MNTTLSSEIENLKTLFAQTPEMFCITSGPLHKFEFVNSAHIKALGFDATGMEVRVAQPESVEVHGILDNVYNTGVTADLHEIPVTLGTSLRYFDLTYGEGKKVTVTVLKKNDKACICVADHGPGIEKANLEKIFQKFERIDATLDISGLGIGLYITKEIVEAHHGRVWAESTVGEGSTFIVELPVK